MKTLCDIYRPITGAPLRNNVCYREISPCAALKPYIRCFWGGTGSDGGSIVIPDTCMDIIFRINPVKCSCTAAFCAMDERSHFASGQTGDISETFAIRFYAWTAALFTRRDFSGSKNRAFPAEEFFGGLTGELSRRLPYSQTLEERAAIAQTILAKELNPNAANANLLNAVYCMLKTNGRARVTDICGYTAVSERGLERLFNANIGISPKALCSLVRYQLLWQQLVQPRGIDILDAVEQFGYTDQSHLLNDFKRRHLMTPNEAVRYAIKIR